MDQLNVNNVYLDLGIALALGLFVGLQRQRTDAAMAGIRTFPLITCLGVLTGLLCQLWSSATPFLAGILAVAVMVVIGFFAKWQGNRSDTGMTTEFAIVLMYVVGVTIIAYSRTVAIAVGAGVAILLQWKAELHGLAARLGDRDVRAIMQFVLVTFIVLPILPTRIAFLPDRAPFDVLNPREAWWMVVLIVGISLAGYLLQRVYGSRAGVLAAGFLGGAISSTATTFSYSRRARDESRAAALAAVVILLASTVVYGRLLFEIAVVETAGADVTTWNRVLAATPLLQASLLPAGVLVVATLAPAILLLWTARRKPGTEIPESSNPSELKSALLFAALYSLVLFALAVARQFAPGAGPFVVAGLSGLTDLDAITLSSARLVKAGQLDVEQAWRLIVVAIMANLFVKLGIMSSIGGRDLWRYSVWFVLPLLAGGFLLVWSR